jgi:excisionase family DNA binding protein
MRDPIPVETAAQIIGCSARHARRLCKESRLRATRYGRDWMVSRSSAVGYAAEEHHPGPKPGARRK